MQTIAILYPASQGAVEELRSDEVDTLDEVRMVGQALSELGFQSEAVACGLDLQTLSERLGALRPALCFNLMEHMASRGSLQHLVPHLLDALRIPYTGTSGTGVLMTTDKVMTKRFLGLAGVATPEFYSKDISSQTRFFPGRYIIKPIAEDASVGIDDSAVVDLGTERELWDVIAERTERFGTPCFAERFVEGREFNLSVLETEVGFEVLPPSEILFCGFAPDKPRIVGYSAKWNACSFEYDHTPCRHDFAAHDEALLEQLSSMALQCGQIFQLGGYYRVDFRVEQGRPYVIEVNANPCISEDAGFSLAARRAGFTRNGVIGQIVEAAFRKGVHSPCLSKALPEEPSSFGRRSSRATSQPSPTL
jgi:D-alanine-D-alanine ligase